MIHGGPASDHQPGGIHQPREDSPLAATRSRSSSVFLNSSDLSGDCKAIKQSRVVVLWSPNLNGPVFHSAVGDEDTASYCNCSADGSSYSPEHQDGESPERCCGRGCSTGVGGVLRSLNCLVACCVSLA